MVFEDSQLATSCWNPLPLLLSVLVFWVLGKMTSQFANKVYQDTSLFSLGDRALGFGGGVLQDLFESGALHHGVVHLPGVIR
jgi:hypothetical protein